MINRDIVGKISFSCRVLFIEQQQVYFEGTTKATISCRHKKIERLFKSDCWWKESISNTIGFSALVAKYDALGHLTQLVQSYVNLGQIDAMTSYLNLGIDCNFVVDKAIDGAPAAYRTVHDFVF